MAHTRPSTLTEDKVTAAAPSASGNVMNSSPQPLNRTFQASLFEQIFNSKPEALSLYNAVNNTSYTNEADLSLSTLSDTIYLGYRNDVSFLIGTSLNLYEHQSSFNPNMPVRGLSYFARLYESYIQTMGYDIYSSTRLQLPKAQYYVFYNGTSQQPDRQILRLSDSYPNDGAPIHLEVCAIMLNINYGHNRELLNNCRTLHDYSFFIMKVREYIAAGYQREKAVELAVDLCINNNVLREFLIRNRAGVITMTFEEYAWNFHVQKLQEEAVEQGLAQGIERGMAQGIERKLYPIKWTR